MCGTNRARSTKQAPGERRGRFPPAAGGAWTRFPRGTSLTTAGEVRVWGASAGLHTDTVVPSYCRIPCASRPQLVSARAGLRSSPSSPQRPNGGCRPRVQRERAQRSRSAWSPASHRRGQGGPWWARRWENGFLSQMHTSGRLTSYQDLYYVQGPLHEECIFRNSAMSHFVLPPDFYDDVRIRLGWKLAFMTWFFFPLRDTQNVLICSKTGFFSVFHIWESSVE